MRMPSGPTAPATNASKLFAASRARRAPRRLISASYGVEAVKLWDVGTRQELLNLSGTGSTLVRAWWSADGDTILAGAPWQAWHAPSWEGIAAAEKGTEGKTQ